MGYAHDSEEPPPGVWGELDALVAEVQAARAAVAAAQAHETELLSRAVALVEQRTDERRARGQKIGNDLPLREVSAELGAAMRVADRTAQRRINDAHTLVARYARTFASWQAGRIERAHAAVIVEEGVIVRDDALRDEYEQLVVAVAEIESAGRLRQIARAIAAQLDPESAEEHRAAAAKSRDIRAYDIGDGLARLIADLPAPLCYAIVDRLTEQSRLIHEIEEQSAAADAAAADEADDGASNPGTDIATAVGAGSNAGSEVGDSCGADRIRSIGQIRADLLADMLLTGVPTAYRGDERFAGLSAIRGSVRVTIPLATLAGVSDDPALLDGVGPVDPELVRRLAGAAPGWDRVYADGPTGLPVAVDRYRPSAELSRYLKARDERCRFPGCRRPAERCDEDHTIDAAKGGPTSACNLGEFCRRHHTLKHASPWTVEQLGGGRFRWTSPTGRVYDDFAPSTLRHVPRFTPDADPPPAAFDDPPPF